METGSRDERDLLHNAHVAAAALERMAAAAERIAEAVEQASTAYVMLNMNRRV